MVPFEDVFPIENGGYIPIAILVKTRGYVLAAKCPGTSRNLQVLAETVSLKTLSNGI